MDPTDPNQQEVPFNLEVLRKHLGRLALARRVLPDDVATRQKLLEDSVYEEATERLKHQAEVFDRLGFGDGSLNSSHLQSWMWDWHQKLQKRLKSEIPKVIEEESLGESLVTYNLCVTLNGDDSRQSRARTRSVWDHSFHSFPQKNSPSSLSSN